MNSRFPPGPCRFPLLGNVFNIDTKNIHLSLWHHKDLYGDMSHISFFRQNIICLNSLDIAQEIFANGESARVLMGRKESFFSRYVLADDIATQTFSREWEERRDIILSCINMSALKNDVISQALYNEFGNLLARLEEFGSKFIDPRELFRVSVTNSVIITCIGKGFDYKHEIFKFYSDYITAADKLFKSRSLGLLPSLRKLPFGVGRTYRDFVAARNGMAEYLFQDLKSDNENDISSNPGIIFELLRHQRSHKTIRDSHIIGFIMDTQSAGIIGALETLLHAVYQLLHRPDIQMHVRSEIEQVVGENKLLNLEHTQMLPYTEAVLLETLRLSSVISMGVPRCSTDDLVIGDYRMPSGTIFMLNLWRMHHDPGVWEDPWNFKPERFIKIDGTLNKELKTKVNPFGIGERSCVGEIFNRSVLLLYVANIIRHFELYTDDTTLQSAKDPRTFLCDPVIRVPYFTIKFRNVA